MHVIIRRTPHEIFEGVCTYNLWLIGAGQWAIA